MKIQVFWDVTQCLSLSSHRRFGNVLTSGSGETHHQPWIFISTAIRTPNLAFSDSFVVYPSSEQLKLKMTHVKGAVLVTVQTLLQYDWILTSIYSLWSISTNSMWIKTLRLHERLNWRINIKVSYRRCMCTFSLSSNTWNIMYWYVYYLQIQFHMPSSNCSSAIVIRPTAKKYFARPPCFIQNHVHRNCRSRITSSSVRRLAITHCRKFR